MSVDGYLCLVSVILIAAVCLLAVLTATMQDPGTRRLPRPRALAILALDLRDYLRSEWAQIAYVERELRLMLTNPGPIVGDREVREEFERRPLAPPMSPDPAQVPFTGWRVPDGYQLPGGRGLMFARPGKQPWLTGQQPAIPVPEAAGPDRAWDPGDGLGPDVPLARPYAPQPVYGEACQLDVAEAERRFALAMGPDGREEVR